MFKPGEVQVKLTHLTVDGVEYEVLRQFTSFRTLIRYEMGAAVIVDWDGSAWTTNSTPASADEEVFVKQYMPAPETTEVDVVK